MVRYHGHPVKYRYSAAAVAEMSVRACTSLFPERASAWWCWAGMSSSLDCTEKLDGAAGDHLSLSWGRKTKAGADTLRLSESQPGLCACSRAAAWCRARRSQRTRRTSRGAGSSRRCSAAPSVMRRLCPRCQQPSPDPARHPWDRQTDRQQSSHGWGRLELSNVFLLPALQVQVRSAAYRRTVGMTSLAKNTLSMARAWEEKSPRSDSTNTSFPCRSDRTEAKLWK